MRKKVHKARRLFSNKPICTKEEGNSLPSTKQDLSTQNSDMLFTTFQVHQPTSPCPTFSAYAESARTLLEVRSEAESFTVQKCMSNSLRAINYTSMLVPPLLLGIYIYKSV